MPRTAPKKCITCSQLSATEAKERHGTDGDGCWNPSVCRARRTYYRNRQCGLNHNLAEPANL